MFLMDGISNEISADLIQAAEWQSPWHTIWNIGENMRMLFNSLRPSDAYMRQ